MGIPGSLALYDRTNEVLQYVVSRELTESEGAEQGSTAPLRCPLGPEASPKIAWSCSLPPGDMDDFVEVSHHPATVRLRGMEIGTLMRTHRGCEDALQT